MFWHTLIEEKGIIMKAPESGHLLETLTLINAQIVRRKMWFSKGAIILVHPPCGYFGELICNDLHSFKRPSINCKNYFLRVIYVTCI